MEKINKKYVFDDQRTGRKYAAYFEGSWAAIGYAQDNGYDLVYTVDFFGNLDRVIWNRSLDG